MNTRNFHQIWRDQCEAAREVRERFGVDHALEYLVGEKLMSFAEAAEINPQFAGELPAFAREVRSIFTVFELERFFASAEQRTFAEVVEEGDEPDWVEDDSFRAQQEKEARERMGWVKAMILNRGS